MPELMGMDPLERNPASGRSANRDGQLMLGLSGPHQRQRLPEPNRSQCVSLLGSMLLAAITPIHHSEKPKQP